MAWDDAKKEKAVKMYLDSEPTAETSVEIVKQIAEDLEETQNGVRMILSKADVYIKSSGTAKATKEPVEGKTTRVSKADSISELKQTISATGYAINDEVLDKLTGKQAVYLTAVIKATIKD